LLALTGFTFKQVPAGFVPTQDKQYLIAFAQLPDAASLERTDAVIRRMTDIAMQHPGVEDVIAFPGLSINGFTNSSNAGIAFTMLKPFAERKGKGMSGPEIAADLQAKFAEVQEAFVAIFPPPPVNGLGQTGGFKLYVEDRAGLGYDELFKATQALVAKANETPGLAGIFSSFTINTPQLEVNVDRAKAKQQGVPLGNIFETMQINLGSLYVNDFNRFGRTYQVVVQADAAFRTNAEDIARLKTRNSSGAMVPLGSLVTVKETYGPDRAMRYNGYAAAEISGAPAPGFSSGEAEALMEKLAAEVLPKGMALDWTELTYQRIVAGNTGLYIFPLSILLVLLVLAAQYESFRLPFAVLLIVPMALLSAMLGVWLTKGDSNIFTQIGLIVLIGLAAKNAILIVEFAVKLREEGKGVVEAALEASRLRLRPILMTSIAFIAGVFPLVVSSGAGAEMRRAMGVAVFSGMIGVTVFGLFLTPVFYVVLERIGARKPKVEAAPHALPESA
jgi:hydrophobe/amphiphile efflux-1 (HAE1) family protein